ncbi:MAG: hypothetical protein HC880_20465, partial [Bacteroidia bacterium]|nr:hypothetical protein [Bacteroidia bacterium]
QKLTHERSQAPGSGRYYGRLVWAGSALVVLMLGLGSWWLLRNPDPDTQPKLVQVERKTQTDKFTPKPTPKTRNPTEQSTEDSAKQTGSTEMLRPTETPVALLKRPQPGKTPSAITSLPVQLDKLPEEEIVAYLEQAVVSDEEIVDLMLENEQAAGALSETALLLLEDDGYLEMTENDILELEQLFSEKK